MRRAIRRFFSRARDLWDRARREHASPHKVGLSVAVGVFSACTPFLFLHMWIALALATLLRLNRLWAFVASRVSVMPVFALITFCELESAHKVRTGVWLELVPREAASRAREFVIDWALGTAIVGGALALALGLLAYVAARRWERALTTRRPSLAHPRSSESPPSAPPAPTR